MHTKPRLLACAILATSLALLAACTRPAISTPQANDLATSTLTATPTITASETTSSTATRRPTRTPHPTRIPSLTPTTTPTRVPGPAQSFLYTQDGVIWRYAFQNWSAEKVTLPAKGYISRVASNTTGEYLAYWDEDGLKLSQRPFASFTLLATTPAEWVTASSSTKPQRCWPIPTPKGYTPMT